MNTYPNMPTPPSSIEDSPPVYFVASPGSSSFQAPENYEATFNILSNELLFEEKMTVSQPRPTLHFVEQPIDKFRFRYKSEMAGTHGSLTGINSDKSRKQTYPTVELKNFSGRAIVRCSIYQSNADGRDFMPHAHRLIMKKGREEQDDPHDMIIGPEDNWRATFHGMGIIHTAKKNIVTELIRKKSQLKRELIARIDKKHRKLTTKEEVEIKGLAENESKSINLNIVCLRFDAFIEQNEILFPICDPIYSWGINNLKSALTGELKIVRLDHVTSPAKGNKEVFVLVERVTKKNVKIRFFELDDEDQVVWEDFGKFNDLDVHHQYAIVFKTPKYRDETITHPVRVFMELVRPSDMARSEPREFTYEPNRNYKPGAKRARNEYTSSSSFNSFNMESDELLPAVINGLNLEKSLISNNNCGNSWNSPTILTSDELFEAMTNVESDEFKKLYKQIETEYPDNVDDPMLSTALGQVVNMSTTFDAPLSQTRTQVLERTQRLVSPKKKADTSSMSVQVQQAIVKLEVHPEDLKMAYKALDELKSFVKTTHTVDVALKILQHYLGEDNRTNILHVMVCQNNMEAVKFLLKLIFLYKQFDFVNNKNEDLCCPLLLATFSNNETLMNYLLLCKAKVGILDGNMNTVLHVAVEKKVSTDLLELLLSDREHEKVKEYIDVRNKNGNTALEIAIEKKYITAMKLLCRKGADVNAKNTKNGFTPLRFAIERQSADVVKYILDLPHLDPTVKDFRDVSPFAAANQKELPKEIADLVQKYMAENNIEMEIKEEMDNEHEDEEMDDDSEIKLEPVLPEELEEAYKKVDGFTSRALDEISGMLDESGKWEHLAELLDLIHIVRTFIKARNPDSISRELLVYTAESNHGTLWEIRNFLEYLDEPRAVEVMDRMVQESNGK